MVSLQRNCVLSICNRHGIGGTRDHRTFRVALFGSQVRGAIRCEMGADAELIRQQGLMTMPLPSCTVAAFEGVKSVRSNSRY